MQLQHRMKEMTPTLAALTTAGALTGSIAGSALIGGIAGLAGAVGGVSIAHAQRVTRTQLLLAPYSYARPRAYRHPS